MMTESPPLSVREQVWGIFVKLYTLSLSTQFCVQSYSLKDTIAPFRAFEMQILTSWKVSMTAVQCGHWGAIAKLALWHLFYWTDGHGNCNCFLEETPWSVWLLQWHWCQISKQPQLMRWVPIEPTDNLAFHLNWILTKLVSHPDHVERLWNNNEFPKVNVKSLKVI